MTCDQSLEAVSAALDGELDENERAELEEHLADCPACRALAEELGLISAALRNEERLPEELADRLSAMLGPAPKRAAPWKRWGALAAALVLAVGLGAMARSNGLLGWGMNASEAPNSSAGDACGAAWEEELLGAEAGMPEHCDSPDLNGSTEEEDPTDNGYGLYPDEAAFCAFWTRSARTLRSDPETDLPAAWTIRDLEGLAELDKLFPQDDLSDLKADYSEEYFENNCLVAVVLCAASGTEPQVVEVAWDTVTVKVGTQPEGGGSWSNWLLILEMEDPGFGDLRVEEIH